jgi:hypothetical protein
VTDRNPPSHLARTSAAGGRRGRKIGIAKRRYEYDGFPNRTVGTVSED